MPRYSAQVDRNQPAIVRALRDAGAEVQHIHSIGRGCPDLLVAFRGVWSVIEVKAGKLSKLTNDEVEWHAKFSQKAPVLVCYNSEDALRAIGAIDV